MNPTRRFFRKYICSTAGILLLFFAVNLLLVLGLFFVSNYGSTQKRQFQISLLSEHIKEQNGEIRADGEALLMLKDQKAWAMLLDEGGGVIWEEGLPKELPRSYSVSEVAAFSRWYLRDYPVTVWTRSDGLLVVGFPKDSVFKYNISNDMKDVYAMLKGAAVVFLMNLFLLAYVFLRNTYRVERAVKPILNGIQQLSGGGEVHLQESGELAEINADLNNAAASLQKKDHARTEWIRGISHDIRTPLSMILGYASEMEEDAAGGEIVRRQAAIIRRQAERIRQLVDDLNLTAKLKYSAQPLRKQRLQAAELARKAVSEVLNEGLSDLYELEFLEHLQGEGVYIEGDPVLFERMFCNLIRNSVVHNPQGCRITVSVAAGDAECCYTVADHGMGLPDEVLDALRRRERGFCTEPEGAEHGLGLKIVCQIVEAYHGRIVFEQTKPHGLTVFLFFRRQPFRID